ncbi:ABC transporter permease [Jeotgalibaca sp. MA1X17-3]|uniref:oligopeptide ABC transporter permease n=1 Tax=Jeotgalibaca sp. MA1X17-3 TaxID=2908211 RepID=UPI001F28202C|nr:oligopeptide ABC transporter permease [Jeotgalibaca sp. MA1X17-3]UJF15581.1 ABC transporter permease [Jeotgalibaca sp. MA1X17-3]
MATTTSEFTRVYAEGTTFPKEEHLSKTIKAESNKKIIFKRFMKHKPAVIGTIVFIIMILMAVFAPLVTNFQPNLITPDFEANPSSTYWLGTDGVGRDVFSRLIYGSRVSLFVGVSSVAIYTVIGTTLGLIAGFFGGKVDNFIMRSTEIIQSFPSFMVILVLVSIIGPGVGTITLVLGLLNWVPLSRIVRGNVLTIKDSEYIQAAISVGYSTPHILFKEILPNVLSNIFVNATFGIASAILTESSLSFLGMGIQPPTASWGNILSQAQSLTVLSSQPWLWIPAGIMILLAVLSINFIGDGLRDAFDGTKN